MRERIEAIKQRIYRNALVQEGETPAESPAALLAELAELVGQFASLATRINLINTQVRIASGALLVEALARRDMLHLMQLVHQNLAGKANPEQDRYSKREIKMVATVNVVEMQKKKDELAREARLLDLEIQQTNWTTDLP